MLRNITNEAALEARDRIPLPQFNGLHESYNALHTKLATQIRPAATTPRFGGTGFATEATSVVDLVTAAKKTSEETDKAQTAKKIISNRQEEKAKDVNDEESGNDTDEEEESKMDEDEDTESDREAMASEDNVSGDDSSEQVSSDDGSGSEEDSVEDSEEDSETDGDTGSEEEESQENFREEGVITIQRDGTGFSFKAGLEIQKQASVNKLEGMTARELSDCVSSSLKIFLRAQQLSSRSAHISDINLLDSGNIALVMRAEKRENLQRIIDSGGCFRNFEESLIGSSVPIYNVEMHKVNIKSLNFQNRKEKSAIIRQLADANHAISQLNGVKPMIEDIRWSQNSLGKRERVLIVEFMDPEQATEALVRGLYWQTGRHGCESADHSRRLVRCFRCQDYGHSQKKCVAPIRCGKCAERHPTATCKSNRVKCASCDGGHHAGNKNCPARAKARRDLGFLKKATSQATTPAAKARVKPPTPVRHSVSVARTQTETSIPSPVSLDANLAEHEIKSESDQSLPEVDPTQDAFPDTATLLKQIEDLRKIVVARDSALQTTSSGRTKRRAGEAFTGGAEAESSDLGTKRVKQEQPTREDSMGLWRQPSPFIINRPQ